MPLVGEEFSLLQDSPFAKKSVINLRGGADLGQLMAAADVLAGSMKPPFFTRVSTGPGKSFPAPSFFPGCFRPIPSLLSDDNFEKACCENHAGADSGAHEGDVPGTHHA